MQMICLCWQELSLISTAPCLSPGAIPHALGLNSTTVPTDVVSFSHFKWSLVGSKEMVSVGYS